MKIYSKSGSLILNKGIYCIINKETAKIYIGSTKTKFIVRLQRHIRDLNMNKHFNQHLQSAWNKYGEDKFEFRILLICNENIYHWEKRAIELTKAFNTEYGYNINLNIFHPPTPSNEARKKQGLTIKERNKISREYLKKYKSGDISFEDIPIEYNGLTKTSIASRNRMLGTKYEDTSHFKVKHTITKAYLESRRRYSEQRRNESLPIEVFNSSNESLGIFRSSKDIEEISEQSPNMFTKHIKGRFSKSRKGRNVDYLSSFWINKSIKESTLYKGLEFKKIIMPSEEEISQIITAELSKNAEMPT